VLPANEVSQGRALAWLLIAVTVAVVWIMLPCYGTLLWACIIALLFRPLFRWLMKKLRGRRTLSALLTTAAAR
jgi:predicted PurR-regulated permease PerM